MKLCIIFPSRGRGKLWILLKGKGGFLYYKKEPKRIEGKTGGGAHNKNVIG